MKILEVIITIIVGYEVLNFILTRLEKYHYVNKRGVNLNDKTLPGFGIWMFKASIVVVIIILIVLLLYMIIYLLFFME